MSPAGAINDPAQNTGSKPESTMGSTEPRIFALIVGINEVLDLRIVINGRYLDPFLVAI